MEKKVFDALAKRVQWEPYAQLLGLRDGPQQARTGQKSLGGYATPIEAGSAHFFALYDGHRGPQARGPQGGDVAARPGAYDRDIHAPVTQFPEHLRS